MSETLIIPPVVKSIVVGRSIEDAFRLYTRDIGQWWPMRTHSQGGEKVAAVVMEGRAGGRLFERWSDGTEKLWGAVTVWEPPARLVHTWHVSTSPDRASEVELRFERLAATRTRVTLEHRHWERMAGETANDVRARYDSGWSVVLGERFGGFAGKVEG